jgi:hypothetical protein
MKEYVAKKVCSKMSINDSRWDSVESAKLDYVWDAWSPAPYVTEAKCVHSNDGITVKMTTTEWPLTITAMVNNDPICIDSCMEFFFTPNADDTDYINFEINPAGIVLTCIAPSRASRPRLDIHGTGVKIESMIFPEEGWAIQLYIPYSFLSKYYSHCDKEMRANFYKCGNETVIPHFATWNRVDLPRPDFHRPEFFGKVILSDEAI